MVDKQGKFMDGLGEFSNRYVKNYKDDPNYQDVNVDICVKLKKEGRAFKIEKYEHNYPHCWRTDKPILYYPLDAWFIRTTAVKDKMVELNKTINWKPRSTGEDDSATGWKIWWTGTLAGAVTGYSLPIWRTEGEEEGATAAEAREEKCISSIAQLKEEIKRSVAAGYMKPGTKSVSRQIFTNPMWNEIILVSDSGKPMRRIADLVDVWFDSGAMPYAQWHFPLKIKRLLKRTSLPTLSPKESIRPGDGSIPARPGRHAL